MVDVDNRLLRSSEVLAQEMKGELLLLRPNDGAYFSLNEMGARVWELCDGSRSARDVAETISKNTGAPISTVEGDVIELVRDMVSEKLVATVE
jgi:hypothetical protein